MTTTLRPQSHIQATALQITRANFPKYIKCNLSSNRDFHWRICYSERNLPLSDLLKVTQDCASNSNWAQCRSLNIPPPKHSASFGVEGNLLTRSKAAVLADQFYNTTSLKIN
jgi:hypothetical protein